MKLPGYAPSMSDRASTREELFEVLELLGGFEEPQGAGPAQTSDLFECMQADPTVSPAELLHEVGATDERFLMEMETFNSLLARKAERIN
jgi:hypothetical protein